MTSFFVWMAVLIGASVVVRWLSSRNNPGMEPMSEAWRKQSIYREGTKRD